VRVCGVGSWFREWSGLVFGLEIVQAVVIVAGFGCWFLMLRLYHLEQTWFSWSSLEVCQDGRLSPQRRCSFLRWSCLRCLDTGQSRTRCARPDGRLVVFTPQFSALLRSLLFRQSRISPRLERVDSPSMIAILRGPLGSSSLPCPGRLKTRRGGDILSGQCTAHSDLLARDAAPVESGWVLGDEAFAVVAGCGRVFGRRLEWGDLAMG